MLRFSSLSSFAEIMAKRLVVLLVAIPLTSCFVGEPVAGEPVACPDIPWQAEFQFYEETVSAPTEVDLVVSTPQTTGACGPGFTLQGVRFFANGTLLGEGTVTRRHANHDPEQYVFAWAVTPGREGVPVSGSRRVVLSAVLVTSEGIKDGRSGLLDPSRYEVMVVVAP